MEYPSAKSSSVIQVIVFEVHCTFQNTQPSRPHSLNVGRMNNERVDIPTYLMCSQHQILKGGQNVAKSR